ncbi:hypothetical protein RBLE17_22080 [Rhodobacteraceae bacterium LE17]|nr:hypothetical protein [Rhodobacteraceae bacterium LE17]
MLFLKKTQFERLLRDDFLQILCLAAQFLDLISVRSTRRIARKPLLPCLHEVLGPFVIYALSDAFTATQLSNAVFATKAIQHDPDLLFG